MKLILLSFLVLILPSFAMELDYTKDIRPILSDRCYNCHGADGGKYGEKWRGGLRLDIKDYAFQDMSIIKFETRNAKLKAEGKPASTKKSEPRFAIVPGHPEKSILLDRIETDDPDEIMPPVKSHLKLSQKEKQLLREWIKQGAKWEAHWSFKAPIKSDLPKVSQKTWPKQDLDFYTLKKLEDEKIQPAAKASPQTLLRRLALSITGLPAQESFVKLVNEKGYEALDGIIDQLLASKSFAERMAVEWFDNARYADTLDYQYDRNRDAWPWKEWVIKSFHENKPFDQFVREQLAGDLLPNPTQDQILATSFNRLHGISTEGGIIQEEYRVQYVNDRVTTFGTTFLGLTFDCTRCHDHKFDPLTMEDFYSMSAFFSNIKEYSKDAQSFSSRSPSINYSITNNELLKTHAKHLNDAIKSLENSTLTDKDTINKWIDHLKNNETGEAFNVKKTDDPKENLLSSSISSHLNHIQSLKINLVSNKAVTLNIDHISLSYLNEKGQKKTIPFQSIYETYAPRRPSINNSSKLNKKYWNIKLTPNRSHIAILKTNAHKIPKNANLTLSVHYHGNLPNEVKWVFHAYAEPQDLIVAKEKNKNNFLNSLPKPSFVHYYKTFHPTHKSVQHYLRTLRTHDSEKNRSVNVLVMAERDEKIKQNAYILNGGAYDSRGKVVPMNTPGFLPKLKQAPKNRLDLANWLFTPEQPLFSRVTVNRIWQMLFGLGLIKTSEDLGSQGELPTHPELLDYLAVEFRTSGWDVKALIKKIVTSSTFQQSSIERATLQDPENILLARGPRYRLNAEFIRDQALAVSELIKVDERGKSPVFPYQPEGLWKELTNRPGSQMVYKESKGNDLYKRSLYSYWKRAQPNPSFTVFDAPKRDICTVKRSKTNTPLQALVTWHDPTYIEASRALAERVIEKYENPKEKISELLETIYQKTFHRSIKEKEKEALGNYFADLLKKYQTQPEKVSSILKVGELDQSHVSDPSLLAAFSSVCLALFNTSEFVTLQ